jgi:Domain of unknown function (DUF4276)
MIKYILISDGSSDRALINIINYALKQQFNLDFDGERADLGIFSRKKVKTLEEKIAVVIDYYEPLLIFIHRDAENQPSQKREEEIEKALINADKTKQFAKIIPIRMTECWLLIDEKAIRRASGNPNGNIKLEMPPVNKLESLPNPKKTLEELLEKASGLTGRRLRDLNTRQSIQIIPEYLEEFSMLEKLPSYLHFKQEISKLLF